MTNNLQDMSRKRPAVFGVDGDILDEDFEIGTEPYEKATYSEWPQLYDVRMKSRQLRHKDESKDGSLANFTNVKSLDVNGISYYGMIKFLTYWVGQCEKDFLPNCIQQFVNISSLTSSINMLSDLVNTPREAAFYKVLFTTTQVTPSQFANLSGKFVCQLEEEIRKEELTRAMQLYGQMFEFKTSYKNYCAHFLNPLVAKVDSLKMQLKKATEELDEEKQRLVTFPQLFTDVFGPVEGWPEKKFLFDM